MTINEGDKIPSSMLFQMVDGEVQAVPSEEILGTGKVVLFALPGAFTRTCSAAHFPGYVVHADAFFHAGYDRIVCLSVYDANVMKAWGKEHNAEDRVVMISDGNAEFTRAVGLEVDMSAKGYGIRSRRYAMLLNDGVIEHLALEEPSKFEVSGAEHLLEVIRNH